MCALALLLAACGQAAPAADDVTVPAFVSPPQTAELAAAGCDDPVPAERDFALPPWPRTDFCRHNVPYDEIYSGGVGRDRIPAIDEPVFQPPAEADLWLADQEPMLVFVGEDDARAYPLQALVWHEIVNDTVGGRPVVVTYCPLCNSGLVLDRTVGGRSLDFGTTGNLRNADLIMYDRQTESWWQQFTGEAIVGELTGSRLVLLPSQIVAYRDFKAQYPGGRVLFPDTGYERPYGENPYINYDSLRNQGTRFYPGETDPRLAPKMRVLGLLLGEEAIAYPFDALEAERVVNDERGGRAVVIFWQPGTVSALDRPVIADSREVGSAAAYSRLVRGQTLTFAPAGDGFTDLETGTAWNIFGAATAGPLAGRRLEPILAHEFFWFAWAAFHPETLVYNE